jgi:hypothetical protein
MCGAEKIALQNLNVQIKTFCRNEAEVLSVQSYSAKVDRHFIVLQKECTCQNHWTLALLKIFSAYTDACFASSWQVTDPSSIKRFCCDCVASSGHRILFHQFKISGLQSSPSLAQMIQNHWRLNQGSKEDGAWYCSSLLPASPLLNVPYGDKHYNMVGWWSLTVSQVFWITQCTSLQIKLFWFCAASVRPCWRKSTWITFSERQTHLLWSCLEFVVYWRSLVMPFHTGLPWLWGEAYIILAVLLWNYRL